MLTGIVLTKNEEANLGTCLGHLTFCDRLLVIDDNSTDSTVDIAKRFNADVYVHPLDDDFSTQHNFALSKVKTGWVLFVDADEIITPELAREITGVIHDDKYHGFYISRHDYLWGRKLRYGDVKNVKIVRLSKFNQATWVGKVHETWEVSPPLSHLKTPILHYPHPTINLFLSRLNRYSTIRAEEFRRKGIKSGIFQIVIFPVLKFLYLYLIKLGFMDGIAGFIHAMSMSFYTFLVRGKLYLLNKGIS